MTGFFFPPKRNFTDCVLAPCMWATAGALASRWGVTGGLIGRRAGQGHTCRLRTAGFIFQLCARRRCMSASYIVLIALISLITHSFLVLPVTVRSEKWHFAYRVHMVFLSHIKQGDRFPLPLWESWFFSSLGVPIPVLIASDRLYDDFIRLFCVYAHRETCVYFH